MQMLQETKIHAIVKDESSTNNNIKWRLIFFNGKKRDYALGTVTSIYKL